MGDYEQGPMQDAPEFPDQDWRHLEETAPESYTGAPASGNPARWMIWPGWLSARHGMPGSSQRRRPPRRPALNGSAPGWITSALGIRSASAGTRITPWRSCSGTAQRSSRLASNRTG